MRRVLPETTNPFRVLGTGSLFEAGGQLFVINPELRQIKREAWQNVFAGKLPVKTGDNFDAPVKAINVCFFLERVNQPAEADAVGNPGVTDFFF